MKKQALGRGLDALIPTDKKLVLRALIEGGPKPAGLVDLPLTNIHPNRYQPRQNFSDETLAELTASIAEKGFLSPITVRKVNTGYEIIAGERRYRAAIKLNLATIPAIIKATTEEESLELALIENLQRDDLNPIEKAKGFQQLITQFKLRQEDVAKRIGQERSTVTNLLRLLQLPESIQNHVSRGTLTFGHARALLSLPSDRMQEEAVNIILHRHLSVRQTEDLVKRLKISPTPRKPKSAPSPEVAVLEDQLRRVFGTQVRLYVRGKRGKI
ncbi:MAG: ParB/RepB/Spo0J family partition protein, partial [bacterium]|nr:ParB/RepB/Spo0J family partition protein [bacterium]